MPRRLLSSILSALGLAAWIVAIFRFFSVAPEGLVLRWDQLGIFVGLGLALFVLAAAVAPKQ